MAIRALLLSADPQAVPAVIQIFKELDLAFEHCNDLPAGLENLANQRFDIVLVDCDKQQDAVPVFEQVRGSSASKSTVAIAIIEGKTGVPSAFHLGATLVLTKPVSLEQTRSTLRTALGMLRRETQAGKAVAANAAAAGQGIAASPTAFPNLGVRKEPLHLAHEMPAPTPLPQLPMVEAPSDLKAKPAAFKPPAHSTIGAVAAGPAHDDIEQERASLAPPQPAASAVTAKADVTPATTHLATPNNVAPMEDDSLLAELEEPESKIAAKPPSAAARARKRSPNRAPLLAAVVAVLVMAALYAAWETVPQLRDPVTSAYHKIPLMITRFRANRQVATSSQSAAQSARTAPTSSAGPSLTQTSHASEAATSNTDAAAQSAPMTAQSGQGASPRSASLQNLTQDGSASNTVTLVASTSTPRKGIAPSSEPLVLPEDASEANLVHKVSAVYPREAKEKKIQGTVVLQAMVDKDGSVDFVKVVNGNDLLISPAVDAVRQWRYKPYLQNGEPVSFVTQVTVDFRLP
jgi:TonB family protein